MKYTFMLVMTAITLAVVGQATALSARESDARFTQKILPINCIFDEINNGLGTLAYLTPAECGQLITPPDNTGQSEQTGTIKPIPVLIFQPSFAVTPSKPKLTYLGQQPEPLPTTTAQNGLLLNTVSNITGISGALVTLKHGDSLYYRPLGSVLATLRKITITDITTDSASFSVSPINKKSTLKLRENISFDTSETNASPAIQITLKNIIASNEPQVTLRLRLLRAIALVDKSTAAPRDNLQKIVIQSLVLVALLASLSYAIVVNRRT
jgi:hypothetical protein